MTGKGPLLAKKPRKRGDPRFEETTLVNHSAKTLECFGLMFGANMSMPSPLASRWLRFFGLKKESFDEFQGCGKLAAALHDVGKANSGFQAMVVGNGVQLLWHEQLACLILSRDPIRAWIGCIEGVGFDTVVIAVLCHHLRASGNGFPELRSPDLRFLEIDWEGVEQILTLAGKAFQISSCPDLSNEKGIWSRDGSVGLDFLVLAKDFERRAKKIRRRMEEEESFRRLVWAVRAAVIAADSAASGLMREGMNLSEWISSAFDEGNALCGDEIMRNVIQPRARQIEAQKGFFEWMDFQLAADTLPGRALLLSACGSGKTLAAWRWIKTRLDEAPRSRVLFLYPTRATATEGFRDYVSWAPEADAALLTGTAAYELEGMFANPEDERFGRDHRVEERLFALAYWHRRVFSATVDQFLGFLQYAYGSVCLLPVLADSVIVIDEVHSFDRNLFTALKGFLRTFDVPVLCMTASLPSNRRKELVEECGLQVFPADAAAFPALEAKARMPRYRVRRIEKDSADERVTAALAEGKRVLWVVNTVTRCQELARLRPETLCYHSRFKLEDRKHRHAETVAAFQQKHPAVLALTTQVCEMSLDLDADVLVSEVAPVTSLIQRMGRCNRHAEAGSSALGDVWLYAPDDEKPYITEDLAGVEGFLSEIDRHEVSQAELEDLLERFGPAGFEPDRYMGFLESGPWAKSREESLRSIEEYCVPGILDTDRESYFELRRTKQSVEGLIVPVPRKLANEDSRLSSFLRVAPGSHYDPRFGLLDHPLEQTI